MIQLEQSAVCGKQHGEEKQDQIQASEHSFNDQVTSVVFRQQAQVFVYLYSSKAFNRVSACILISKQGKKTAIILWAQNWLDNHTIQ